MTRSSIALKLFPACTLAVLLANCSSSKKDDENTGAATSRLNGGIQRKGFDRKTGDYDHSVVSEFDRKKYSAGKKVKDQKFRTDQFAGKHDYTGSTAYKAKEFSQSGKQSREGKEAFSDASHTSKEASKNYETTDSRYGSQKSRQGDKSFAGGDETYKTGAVRDAAKSQKKNVRPEIIPKDEETGKSAYTEAEVRRMVNRN